MNRTLINSCIGIALALVLGFAGAGAAQGDLADGRTVILTSPAAHEAYGPSDSVLIEWEADLIDITSLVYMVQVRNLADSPAHWEGVDGTYTCRTVPGTLGGICSLETAFPAEGRYAVRVMVGPSLDDDNELGSLCIVPQTCDIVFPVLVDATPPMATKVCAVVGGGCAEPGATVDDPMLAVGVSATDNLALGHVLVEARAQGTTDVLASCEQTFTGDPVLVIDANDVLCTIDLSAIFATGLPGFAYGDLELFAVVTDRVQLDDTVGTPPYRVDSNGEQNTVRIQTLTDLPRYVQSGTMVDIEYRATFIDGPNPGAPAALLTLVVTDGLVPVCTTVLGPNGVGHCEDLVLADGDHALKASVADPTLEVLSSTDELAWTSLDCSQNATLDLRNGGATQTRFANPGDVYAPAIRATFTFNGEGVPDAVAVLRDGGSSTVEITGGDGWANVPALRNAPETVDFEGEVRFGDLTPVTCTDPVTVSWAQVEFVNALVTNLDGDSLVGGDNNAWHDIGDEIQFTFDVVIRTGAATTMPAEGAVVEFVAGSTDQVTLGNDGKLTLTRAFATPTRLTPAITLVSTQQELSTTVPDPVALFGEQRWATVLFSMATVTNEGNDVPNWHDVDDLVTFAFDVHIQPGVGTDDAVPAEGAEVLVNIAGVEQTLTVGADGHIAVTRQPDVVTVNTPAISLVSTPQLVSSNDMTGDFFDEQIWTEMIISASADDSIVNVGDTITLTLDPVVWAHGAMPLVSEATVLVFDSEGAQMATCNVTDGAATCEATKDVVYANGLTLVVQSSDKGVTRQFMDTLTHVPAVWTALNITDCMVDDAFVNVGDTIQLTCDASYAHNGAAVEDTTFSLAEGTDASCAIGPTNEVVGGVATVDITCTDVVDAPISLDVASNTFDVDEVEDAVEFLGTWTGLIVSYEASRDDGSPVADGALLPHNAPVAFDFTVKFAHLVADPDGTPAPAMTFFVPSVDEAGGSDGSNCVVSASENEGSCVTEFKRQSGEFTLEVDAASIIPKPGSPGIFETDITLLLEPLPSDLMVRWTSIGFDSLSCEGSHSGVQDCSYAFTPGEIVTVTVRAIAEDTRFDAEPQVLTAATIKISGQEMTTNADGEASRDFFRFSAGCSSVNVRGLSADFGGANVTWTTPLDVEICWG